MARGNIVQVKTVRKMFGLYVVESMFGSFKDYDKIYLSSRGRIIGKWGVSVGIVYKDYLWSVPNTCKLIYVADNYIVFKP